MAAIKNRGRAGLAGALLLSFIASFLLLAPVVYFPTASLSFAVFIYFLSIPYKKTPVSARARHQISASFFENANSFYLRPAPVTEWVSEWWQVCLACSCRCARAFICLAQKMRLWCSRLPLRPGYPRFQSVVHACSLSVSTAGTEMIRRHQPLVQVQIRPVTDPRWPGQGPGKATVCKSACLWGESKVRICVFETAS